MAIVRNLATVKTTADITSSATSIPVNRLNVFGVSQTTLDNPFYVTIMPASGDEPANLVNSEIALVTGMSGLNLTVTRGQRDTTARAFSAGAIVTMGIYAEDAVLNSGVKSGVNNAQTELRDKDGNPIYPKVSDVESSQIADSAVTTAKIGGSAVTTAKIANKNVTTAKLAAGIVTMTRTVLYNNGSGTNANFSTTTAMSNYDVVEVSYRDGNQNYAFKYIPGPAGSFVLDVVHPGANSVAFWYMSRYLVSGTNITVGANNMRKAIGTSSVTTTAAQDIYITRIVGIKFVSN